VGLAEPLTPLNMAASADPKEGAQDA